MGLRADAVDGNALRDPLVHEADHAGCLCVVGNVKVVIVDVEFGVGISGTGGAEGDTDEIFAEDASEDAVSSQVAVFAVGVVRNGCGLWGDNRRTRESR